MAATQFQHSGARLDQGQAQNSYSEHVNPQWVRLLDVLQMNVRYTRCVGAELFTDDGRRILDFLSGYCVHNLGHNHPAVIEALHDELDRRGPAMLQSHVAELAGELAAELVRLAGGRLSKVYFSNSGSEGIDTVIKFTRIHTGRKGLLYAKDGFHGLTCGPLSLMADTPWRKGFGPMLPETEHVPFGDINQLERKLSAKKFAAYILEPVQAESGIVVPTRQYMQQAEALCRRYGTMLVYDEVQTGFYRTGKFLAAHSFGVEPDMIVVAKALSGGLVPSSAVLMSEEIYDSVFGSLGRSMIHSTTYGENSLAMRAGLAAVSAMQRETLGQRSEVLGEKLRQSLREALSGYEMVEEVRGLGMLNGIAFRAPKRLEQRLAFEAFRRIHPGMFGQMVVMRLFREQRILTQICGNNLMVLKVAPPLIVSEEQIQEFVTGVRQVVDAIDSSGAFWRDALQLAKRAVKI